MMVFMQPRLRPGYMVNDQLAVPIISDLIRFSDIGSACPPNSLGCDKPCQPPATYSAYASLKPLGVVTSPSWMAQPSWSPLRFKGASTSSQKVAAPSMMASTMSGVASPPLDKPA